VHPEEAPAASLIDPSVVHPARRYNYLLGGKDNFAADRDSGDALLRVFPTIRAAALANRQFMVRAVHYVAGAGVRQFLDIGTGIPAPDNTHEVAQAVAPESRVVYVDNDPIVMAHARALLTSSPEGRTAYLQADVREGAEILRHPTVTGTLDLNQPVALVLVAVLHFLDPSTDAHALVAELMAGLPSGSYLILSHATNDFSRPELRPAIREALGRSPIYVRTAADMARFFTGMTMVDPGITIAEPGISMVSHWRAESEPELSPVDTSIYAAVGRKP
jgi:hypothetical protein